MKSKTDSSKGSRPLSFYLDVLLALTAGLIALVTLTGGIDFKFWPFRIHVVSLEGPAWVLLALLVLRRGVAAARKKSGEEPTAAWQDFLLGPRGSVKERWRSTEVLLFAMAAFAFFTGEAALARYRHFGFDAASLGTVVQTAWNLVEGNGFVSSLAGEGNWLGRSFSPVMAVVAQGGRLFDLPVFLITLQTLAVTLGAVPVYLLGMKQIEERRWALALALLYLAHPAVRGVILAGFHPVTLAVTPLLFAWYLLDERRRWGGYAYLALALACGEEAWLAAALVGLYICTVRRRWREGLFLFLLAFYGFLLLVSFGMPKMGGEVLYFSRFAHLGEGMMEIVGAILFSPGDTLVLLAEEGRVAYVKDLLLPLAGLPLLGPLQFAVGLPLILSNLLAGSGAMYTVESPHAAMTIPFLFAAAAVGLRTVRDGRILRRLNLLAGPLLCWALIFLPLAALRISPAIYFRGGEPPGYRESFAAAAALVPETASLATENSLVPYFAEREGLYLYPEVAGTEYVLLESAAEEEKDREALQRLVREEKYEIAYRDGIFILFSREIEDGESEAAP